MFSTTPSTGTSTRFHIAMAFSTSMTDTSCGVVTITAPVMGISCDSDSCASPVPGRQVDQQVVERPPLDVLQELLQQLVHHRPAPDHRAAALDEEAHRDDAAGRGAWPGVMLVAGVHRRRHVGIAHHLRDGRAVDVGVEDAHLGPAAAQGARPGWW